MLTGNKGEWSEIYAFLRILGDGKLFAADADLNRIKEVYFPVIKIIREEFKGKKYLYITGTDIEVWLNDNCLITIPADIFTTEADNLFHYIDTMGKKSGAFAVTPTESFMNKIYVSRLAAPSTDKSDINMEVHDIETGYTPTVGFSIKSELGGPSTLLNAGKTTNFVFRIDDLPEIKVNEINNINSTSKIKDRINSILNNGGALSYLSMESTKFENNLMMIDSQMPIIISEIVLAYFKGTATTCRDLLNTIIEKDPVSRFPDFYNHKVKEFLCAVALGMKPATPWDGTDEATGGYIIVKSDGDVLAYHIYNRDSFRGYLLKNTKLETPSSSRHGFGTIYSNEDGMFINLNLQIRFI